MSSSTVRPVLIVDALISGATGALLVITAPMLETWLDLPAPLLRYAGIILLPFAGGVVDWGQTPILTILWIGVRRSRIETNECRGISSARNDADCPRFT